MSTERRMRMAGSPLGHSARSVAVLMVLPPALLSGGGDMRAQRLLLRAGGGCTWGPQVPALPVAGGARGGCGASSAELVLARGLGAKRTAAGGIWDGSVQDLVLWMLVFSLHSYLEKCYAAEPNSSAQEGSCKNVNLTKHPGAHSAVKNVFVNQEKPEKNIRNQ